MARMMLAVLVCAVASAAALPADGEDAHMSPRAAATMRFLRSKVQVTAGAKAGSTPAAAMAACMQEHVQLFDRGTADLIDACARVTSIRCAKFTDHTAAFSCWEKDAKPICAGQVPGLAEVQRVRHVQAHAAEQARIANERSQIAAHTLATGHTAALTPIDVESSKYGSSDPEGHDAEEDEESEEGDEEEDEGDEEDSEDEGSEDDDSEDEGSEDDDSEDEGSEDDDSEDEGSEDDDSEDEGSDDDDSEDEDGSFLQAQAKGDEEDVADDLQAIRVRSGTGILPAEELEATAIQEEGLDERDQSATTNKEVSSVVTLNELDAITTKRKMVEAAKESKPIMGSKFEGLAIGNSYSLAQLGARSELAEVPVAVLNALESTCTFM